MFSTATLPTALILRIHSQAAALAADPSILAVMAAAYVEGPELRPDASTLALFQQWLTDEYDALTREVCVAWVNREVPLAEAVAALRGPLLPGETMRTMPVSTLGTAPVPGLMTAEQNLQFRAVHDAMHAKLESDDSWVGELATTLGHMATACPQIWPILASEVAGQAAVAISTGEFPEQRLSAACLVVLAPVILG